eukprot:4852485-Alexandrium_andersonii.AAC.1
MDHGTIKEALDTIMAEKEREESSMRESGLAAAATSADGATSVTKAYHSEDPQQTTQKRSGSLADPTDTEAVRAWYTNYATNKINERIKLISDPGGSE